MIETLSMDKDIQAILERARQEAAQPAMRKSFGAMAGVPREEIVR